MRKCLWVLFLAIMGCATTKPVPTYSDIVRVAKEKEDAKLYDEALALYRKSIDIEPRNSCGYLGVGRVLYKKGGSWRARIFLEKAKGLGAGGEADLFLALVALRDHKYDEAIKLYHSALKIQPFWNELTFEIGRFYLEQGQINFAKDKFALLVETEPQFWGGHWGLGQIYIYNDSNEVALKEILLAYHINPSELTLASLAEVYLNLGAYAEAHILYKKFLAEYPKSDKAEFAKKQLSLISDSLQSRSDCKDGSIKFVLENGKTLRVCIYDFEGKEVKVLFEGFLAKGKYELNWDGTDKNGNKQVDGIYFASVEGEDFFDAFVMRLTR